MALVTAEEFKDYLFEDDDTYQSNIANMCILTAQERLLTAIGCKLDFLQKEENLELSKIAIAAQAATIYEYRQAKSEQDLHNNDLTFGAIVSTLRARFESENEA
ncbi:head-tail adaptor Ad1 [Streptococcus phage APCM01]|uniref:head-tail adaptor Ad1 n=1 Tax=Streptococcus phage APCM01 TaxID=1647391 RepID=UPI00067A52B8|nr:head-tail adaptor Ad1 [Streptococcus phage APCM01]AKI28568.1 DNA packaging protein [Streptococcus phage APCM01]